MHRAWGVHIIMSYVGPFLYPKVHNSCSISIVLWYWEWLWIEWSRIIFLDREKFGVSDSHMPTYLRSAHNSSYRGQVKNLNSTDRPYWWSSIQPTRRHCRSLFTRDSDDIHISYSILRRRKMHRYNTCLQNAIPIANALKPLQSCIKPSV